MKHKGNFKILLAVLILLSLFITSCEKKYDEEGNKTSAREVVIRDKTFHPEVIKVPVGTEITWVNQDKTVHTVTSGIPEHIIFDSGEIQPNGSFSFEFIFPGNFEYYCDIHPEPAKGKIVVVKEIE